MSSRRTQARCPGWLRLWPQRVAATCLAALSLLVFGSLWAGVGGGGPGAGAAEPGRAVVVVDTGRSVYKQVITFSGSSISGLEALQLAGASPQTIGYSGQGTAVCKAFGVGNEPTQSACLGTPSDPRYWAYFRAPAGSGGYSFSPMGAGATRVSDGDVEGWRFGTGSAPPFFSFCEVAGCAGGGGGSQGSRGLASGAGGGSDSGGGSGQAVVSGSGSGAGGGGNGAASGESSGATGASGTSGDPGAEPGSSGGSDDGSGGAAGGGPAAAELTATSGGRGAGHAAGDGSAGEGSAGEGSAGAAGARRSGGLSSPWSLLLFGLALGAVVSAGVVARRRLTSTG